MEGYKVTLVAVAFLAYLVSCGEPVQTAFKLAYEKALIAGRAPGEKLLSTYEDIVKTEDCKETKGFIVKEDRIIPSLLNRGERLNHRIVYVLCDKSSVKGTITRVVERERSILMRDRTDYEFKPGKWVLDAFIEVPPNAKEGSYIMQSEIKAGTINTTRKHPFIVR